MTQRKNVEVLIIDDDKSDARILQHHLSRCKKFTVSNEYVADLQQALEKLSNNCFDLIFLDNRLDSCITAKDVIESFSAKNINTPVVVITGADDEQTMTELKELGVYAYIVKDTINSEILEKAIISTTGRYLQKIQQEQLESKIKITKEIS